MAINVLLYDVEVVTLLFFCGSPVLLTALNAALLYVVMFIGYVLFRQSIHGLQSFLALPRAMTGELHSQFCWRHVLVRVHWLLLQVACAALLVIALQLMPELSLQGWMRPLSIGLVFVALTTACWCVVGYVWFLKIWLIGPDRRQP